VVVWCFNQDSVKASRFAAHECEILAAGLGLVAGWRVPIDTSVLGRLALERLPQIGGIGGEGLSDQEFAIKRSACSVVVHRWPMPLIVITSILKVSHKTIIYKGCLMMPADLRSFTQT
jgi:glutamate synthase (NADPH/NADH) large chain